MIVELIGERDNNLLTLHAQKQSGFLEGQLFSSQSEFLKAFKLF